MEQEGNLYWTVNCCHIRVHVKHWMTISNDCKCKFSTFKWHVNSERITFLKAPLLFGSMWVDIYIMQISFIIWSHFCDFNTDLFWYCIIFNLVRTNLVRGFSSKHNLTENFFSPKKWLLLKRINTYIIKYGSCKIESQNKKILVLRGFIQRYPRFSMPTSC